jgi:hypothetical protein
MTRAEEAAERAALAAAREHAESQAAQQLIDAFVVQARERGLPPEPLRATLYTGQSVRTDKTGWYLRKNKSIAIGEDGSYYVLTIPGGLRERFSGARLEAKPPPLEVGRGGRDGETGDLAEFLRKRLEAGAI